MDKVNEVDYFVSLTVTGLQEECKSRGRKITGNRPVLLARLKEAVQNQSSHPLRG